MYILNVSAGIDFKQKIINLDGTPIKLQIWWVLIDISSRIFDK